MFAVLKPPPHGMFPWLSPEGSHCSHPEPWALGKAREYCRAHGGHTVQYARGVVCRQVFPEPGKWRHTPGLRMTI
jgi:hypothetical protein